MLRRLVLLVGAAVLVDTAYLAVIAPLLPGLTHDLHLSKTGAGVLTASYPAGMLLAAIPGGVLAIRLGPRRTVCAGLTLLALATLGFGLLNDVGGLDAARFVEGAAGSCSWAGGIAWLVQVAPRDRWGVTIGQAVGAAVAGSMLGPAIGALASVTGRGGLFAGLAAVALGLAAVIAVVPTARATVDPSAGRGSRVRAILPLLRDPDGRSGMWLMTLPAIASGLLTVLGALRLHALGATTTEIGLVFFVSAGFELVAAPIGGTLSDRRGRIAPMRAGLLGTAVTLALFTVPGSAVGLAVLIVLTAVSLSVFWAPSMALVSDAAGRLGVEQGHAAALQNLAWAAGQIIGSAGGGAAAALGGDALPAIIAAAVCAATFLALLRGAQRTVSPGQEVGRVQV